MQLQYRLLPLFDAMLATAEFPEGFRRGALIRGWDLGKSRQPLSTIQQSAADKIQSKLSELMESFRLDVAKPSVRPSSRTEGIGNDMIDRIVRQVLEQLGSSR
jgi:4-hydroxy-tetrahydrodipicolinate synthase